MVAFQNLGPQDPIPDGRAVIVMRRLAEDSPNATVVELIVRHTDGREETALLPSWTEAAGIARTRATEAGLPTVYLIDRTAGPLAAEILKHDGDHSLDRNTLEDSDMEDDEPGPDMRDRGPDGAPRRF